MTTAYVLGAGASHAYEVSPTGVRPPFARGFFSAYHNLAISKDFEARVGDIVNHVRDVYGLPPERFGEFDQDVEQFMTHLDIQLRQMAHMRARGESEAAAFGQFAQSSKAYDQMIFLIAHVLNEIQNGPISDPYTRLVHASDASDAFITFNWDTLLDRALLESGRWTPDTGYGVLFESLLDETWREPRATESEPKLLKLHGSTNWLVNYVSRTLDTGERAMTTIRDKPGYATIVWEPNFDSLVTRPV